MRNTKPGTVAPSPKLRNLIHRSSVLTFILLAALTTPIFAQIAVDGRYWKLDGQRVLLLGAWNHGHNPFIDHDTDNDRDARGVSTVEQIAGAMDELVAAGGNYLRCVLDPGMAAGIQKFDFCARSGQQYDLETMKGPFWKRLEMFVSEARKRDIVVQFEIWDRFDWINSSWESWQVSPWNPQNNVNYTTDSSGLATFYRTYRGHPFSQGVPGHPEYEKASKERKQQYDRVRRFQEKFVDHLLSITLRYDNVLYCMNNETHEDPAWGRYWINFIRDRTRREGKRICATDMFDKVFEAKDSPKLAYQLQHRDTYDYIDISQANSRHRDEEHWNRIAWIAKAASKTDPPYLLHMTKLYGNDLALDGQPWSRWRPGDTENAIEEWWRDLLVGVAGVRFHRPTAGIGLCEISKNCIRATRKVESLVPFWNLTPKLELLTDRQADEAYVAADPGKAYVLYFTKGGGDLVGLDLRDVPRTEFQLRWINVATGNWGPQEKIRGGHVLKIQRPNNDVHWVAAIVK